MIDYELKILESSLSCKQKELLMNPFNKSVINRIITDDEKYINNSYFVYNFLFSIHDFSNEEIHEIIQFINDSILETKADCYLRTHFNSLFLKKGTSFEKQLDEINKIIEKKSFDIDFFLNNFYFISKKNQDIIIENNFNKLIELYFDNIQIVIKKDNEYIKLKINDKDALNYIDFDGTIYVFDMDNLKLLNKDEPLTLDEFKILYSDLLSDRFVITGEEFYLCFEKYIPKRLIKLINMNYIDNQNSYFNDILNNQKHNFYKYSTSVYYFFDIIKTESIKLTGTTEDFDVFENNMMEYLYNNKYLKNKK